LLSPLAWLVARDAAERLSLSPRRKASVAVGAGILVAISGPLVMPAVMPDSTLPFTVLGVAACLLMPSAACLVQEKMGLRATVLIPELAWEFRVHLREDLPLDSIVHVTCTGANLPLLDAHFRVR